MNQHNLYLLIKQLFPICRSITGDGTRKTLHIIQKHIPLKIKKVLTGKKVFDWVVPKEWNINDAYIKNSKGEKVVDFKKSNLHVLNYSIPVNKKLSLSELKKHLYTLPKHPNWIPYLTSYYDPNWGFCLSHNQYKKLTAGFYDVFIDSTLKHGCLNYGELLIKGKRPEEIIFSCYICHPSMCNDNLSGVSIVTFLAKQLLKNKLKYSYRFLFVPETIGAITWLSHNKSKIKNIKCGLIATCLGDSGKSTYKKTRTANTIIDQVVERVLIDSESPYDIIDFAPFGSDERQFCSPGLNLPFGVLMRTPFGQYPEYHTSADNLDFIKEECLIDSFNKYLEVIFVLENNETYLNVNLVCEPHLRKNRLYSSLGALRLDALENQAIFWILNLSDGSNSLLDISFRSKIKFRIINKIATLLHANGLIKKC